MIKGVLMVNSYGGLVFNRMNKNSNLKPEINKVIALGSTIYTGLEILKDKGLCKSSQVYTRLRIELEKGVISVFSTVTRLIFIVIHDLNDSNESVENWIRNIHRKYVDLVLYSPGYFLDGQVPVHLFSDIF
ncbi:hypothetical protein NEOKW01_1083 [Nematocida sp. AWRm80]|nr:hypothetical protein NEOKW01_1083 [Nematocida sp. AWRm80]